MPSEALANMIPSWQCWCRKFPKE